MANNAQLLSELTPGPNWDCINVRVSRIWDSITKTAKEVYSKNLQLLDVKGNQIHALVPKSLVDKFLNTFEEQSIYEIESFNVYPSQPNYRVINEELMIILRRDTQVKKLHGTIYNIPKYKFGFVDDDILAQRIDKVSQLTDITGVLRSISDVVQITTRMGCQTSKRELIVCTGSAKNISVTLWADKTNLIDVSANGSENKPPSLIFTSMLVKLFKGEFTFSSTNATQMYSNLDYPDVANLITSEIEGSTITTVEHQQIAESTKDDNEIRSTISKMMADIRANECNGKKYVVYATLIKINTSFGWSYLSCPLCRKTVTKEATGFACPKCNNAVEKPVSRYRLSMEVLDHTGSATVIAFDKDAACLVRRSVDELMDLSKKDNGDDMVDRLFNSLMGSEARFEFKPANYDIINRGKTLTVSRISNMHQPYAPLNQQPNKMEADDNKGFDVTQLTAESSTLQKINSELKGKQKVDQEHTDFANKEMKTNCTLEFGSTAQPGIVIGADSKKDRGKQKIRGKTADKKRKK